jgi:hypothetical protein
MTTTPIQDRLEKAYSIVAFASLSENQEPVFLENVEAEASRIERCVEYFYTKENHDLQYPEYASKFLQERYKDIVYGVKYLGDWLGDVQESTGSTSVNDYSLVV